MKPLAKSLFQVILQRFKKSSDEVLFIEAETGKSFKYSDISNACQLISVELRSNGFSTDDRIIIAMGNSVDFFSAFLSTYIAGLTPVIINPALSTEKVEQIIERVKAKGIITDMDSLFNLSKQVPLFLTRKEIHNITSGIGKGFPEESSEKSEAYIIFSSGSTDQPKGIVISPLNVLTAVKSLSEAYEFEKKKNHLVVMPTFHASALHRGITSPFYSGKTIILAKEFVVEEFWHLVKKYKINFVQVVPTILNALLTTKSVPDESIKSHLTYIGSASAPHPAGLVEKFRKHTGIPVAIGYGLTETTCGQFLNPPSNQDKKNITSVGRPIPGVKVEIRDEKGNALPAGSEGEVFITSDMVAIGFVDDTCKNDKRILNNTIETEDIGYLDKNGNLFLASRKSELIIRGGYNISPPEIENVISKIPNVKLAVAFGVPNAILGEDLIVYVDMDSPLFNEAQLKREIQDKLPRYKIPSRILILPEDLKQEQIKISRKKISNAYMKRLKMKEQSYSEFKTSQFSTENFTKRAFLQNDAVFLRPLMRSDIKSEIYLNNIMDQEVQFYTLSGRYPQSEFEIERYWESVNSPGNLVFAVCDKKTSEYVGNIALRVDYELRIAEFGRMIFKEHQGKPYSIEALTLVLEYAFEQLQIEKVWGGGANPRSLPSLYKLGFTLEGKQRKHFVFKGKRRDLFLVGMLRSDYFSIKEHGVPALNDDGLDIPVDYFEKIKDAFESAFIIKRDELRPSMGPNQIENWDSMGVVSLWNYLEDIFKIQLESSDLIGIKNVYDVFVMVKEKES